MPDAPHLIKPMAAAVSGKQHIVSGARYRWAHSARPRAGDRYASEIFDSVVTDVRLFRGMQMLPNSSKFYAVGAGIARTTFGNHRTERIRCLSEEGSSTALFHWDLQLAGGGADLDVSPCVLRRMAR